MQEKEVGKVTHYYNHLNVGIIELSEALNAGDTIHIKGAHDDFKQKISSMQYNHNDIPAGRKGQEIGIKVKLPVHENDKVYVC